MNIFSLLTKSDIIRPIQSCLTNEYFSKGTKDEAIIWLNHATIEIKFGTNTAKLMNMKR